MAPAAVNHDHTAANAAPQQASQPPAGIQQSMLPSDMSNVQLGALDPNQIMTLLRSLPNVFNKVNSSPVFFLFSPLFFSATNPRSWPIVIPQLENTYDR